NFTRTVKIGGATYNYATLGGEPSLPGGGGKLISTLNASYDNARWALVVWSTTYNCAADQIGQIIGAHTNYVSLGPAGWVDYPLGGIVLPTDVGKYNCNGYTNGLISTCGYSVPQDLLLINWNPAIRSEEFFH